MCSKYEDSRAGLGTMARSRKRTQPHIIILLADDLGWNEVSWNNKLFLTPNLQVRSEDTAQCENAGGRGSNLLHCGEVSVLDLHLELNKQTKTNDKFQVLNPS